MGGLSEEGQKELERVHGRLAHVNEFLMAAHTAAKRLAETHRGPNFGPRVLALLEQAQGLHDDILEVAEANTPDSHRGLRVPHDDERCTDVDCPIASTREPHTH